MNILQFLENQENKTKVILNFPNDILSLLKFNEKSFFYDKIYYVQSEAKESQDIIDIK